MQQPASPTPLLSHQSAFDLVSEGVLWVNKGGKVAHANAAAAATLGYSPARLAGSSYLEIDPNYSMLGWKKFWKLLNEDHGEFLETQFVNAAGMLFGVRVRVGFDALAGERVLAMVVFTPTEAGRRERDLLDAVQEDANVGSWEYNLGTGQVFLSARLREWLGWSLERDFYPANEALEKLSPHLPPGQKETLSNRLTSLLQAARVAETSMTILAADGKATELLLRARSVENEIEVFKVYGTARRAADQLVAPPLTGEADLQGFSLDQVRDAVFRVDLTDGTITYANARARELTGYGARELTGRPLTDLLAIDAATPDKVRAAGYLETETHTRRRDGTAYPTRATLHFREADGQPYMVVISRDVSREEEEVEYRRLHATTLDSLQEWVIWLDADNRVVMMNAAATKKLSRRTTRELHGLPIGDLMPDLDIPPPAQLRREQIDGRIRSDVDYVYADTNGKERTLQVRFAQVAADSRLYLSVVCRDVTTEVAGKRRLRETKRRVDELRKQLESENEALKEEIDTVNASGPIITVSPTYRKILAQIGQVAGTDATVLVTGETGTGKELLAQSIHNFSLRGGRRMVSVNCAALPENLIESELFGHERGAFTGAFTQKKGKFELADGGTIFLDEIGELPLEMQAKLLRALQEGEIQRIGSSDVIKVDVRVVAATNRNLEKMIREGTFREDLFYRLNVFPIHNISLRERPEDIPVLVKHFTKIYARKMGRAINQINQRDLEQLQAYDFPGNVRELINLVERAVITSNSTTLNLGASLRALRRTERGEGTLSLSPNDRLVSFEEMQRQYIMEALRRTGGKVTGAGGAAELLDINGRTLMSKMVKLGIERSAFSR